jgi:hypothetical protein
MAKEPAWKYLAGIDTANAAVLKRYMTLAISRLNPSRAVNKRIPSSTKVSTDEQDTLRTMFHEMAGNHLLQKLTLRWAKNYHKPAKDILEATEHLKRDATFYVRRPDLYKEEFRVADQAFEEGGWVYMGQVVHWEEIPEEELKRAREAIIKRAKNDAEMDGIEYVPDPGMEDVDSEDAEEKAKKEADKAEESEEAEESEDVEENEEDDLEDADDEVDEDYEDEDEQSSF